MHTIPKLDAVNRILKGVDGSVVSDLNQPQNGTVLQIVRALEEASEKIQYENEWNFNYDGPRELTVNEDTGEITIPSDYLYLKFITWDEGNVWDLTTKNGKVWNRKDGTAQVAGTVKIGGSRLFTFEECPSIIQNYIIEKAKFLYLGGGTHLSQARYAIAEAELRTAYTAALKWDAQQQFGIMEFGPSIREGVQQRGSAEWWRGF